MSPRENYRAAIRSGKPDSSRFLERISQEKHEIESALSRSVPLDQFFNWSGDLYRYLPDEEDRIFLSKRVRLYLLTNRRGKLRLPSRFPKEIRDFTKLTKSQLRDRLYAVRPHTALDLPTLRRKANSFRQAVPGGLWIPSSDITARVANQVDTVRLGKHQMPRITRPEWPSTPTASELLAMSRRGYVSRGMTKPEKASMTCLTRQLISEDFRLATKIVKSNVVGIRSCQEVPEKFLKYFRYRDGFLILTVRWCLPIGLVRFLISQWIRRPTSLWLVENCRLKYYLRSHTVEEFSLPQWTASDTESVPDTTLDLGMVTTGPSLLSVDDIAAEMGDEFAEFYRLLPD